MPVQGHLILLWSGPLSSTGYDDSGLYVRGITIGVDSIIILFFLGEKNSYTEYHQES